MSASYLIPAGEGLDEFTEKRSRFIGHLRYTPTEEAALALIRECREEYWDASHNVYAYIVRENGAMRYSDDGEPQGTGGMPVLNVLRSAGLTDVCCVVTRYFGGTLLGAGGLLRAYSHGASIALADAGVSVMRPWSRVRFKCPYGLYERLRREPESFEGVVDSSDFGESVELTALIPEERTADFLARLIDASSGAVRGEAESTEFRAVRIK